MVMSSLGIMKNKRNINNNNNNDFDKEKQDDHMVTSCGLGSWRPEWLQVFAKPIYFIISYSLIGVVQSMSSTYLFAVLTSIEKRYAFDSKISGIILIADNIMEMLLSTLIGYLGNRYSRPKMIAISEMILVLSCVISASPYFIYGPGTHLLYDETLLSKMTANNTRYELCSARTDTMDCAAKGGHSTIWGAVIMLVIGSALRGIGYTAYWFKGASVKEKDRVDYDNSVQGFWECCKRLLTNPLFMYNLIGNAFRYNGYAGYGVTKPKYIESQYRVSGSKANLLTGVTGMLPVAIGVILGGVGIRYLKPRPFILLIYIFALEWVSNGSMFASMFLGCPPIQLGPNTEMANTKFTMNADCNLGCECTTSVFTPMCSADKVTTYFSPCFAGCTHLDKNTGIATNCSCISDHGGVANNAFIPYPIIYGAIADSVCLSMSSTYLFAVLTSIEKRFAFDSRISGIILVADNTMEMLLSTLIGYLAARHYTLFTAREHTYYTTIFLGQKWPQIIPGMNYVQSKFTQRIVQQLVVTLLYGPRALRGVGYTAYCVFGLAFIDDSVSKKSSPLYMSLWAILRMIGPAAVDPHVSSRDPRFIGAWWIGFLVIAGLLFLATLPMFLFPRQLKGASVKEKDRIDYDNSAQVTTCGLGTWRPRWLQVFATPFWFAIVYALIGVVQTMSTTYLIALSPLVGYLGNRYSRPRMIAVSEMILVLSCVINAAPYFIYGPGTHLLYDDTLLSKMTANNTRYELCSAKVATIDCTAKGVNPNVKSTDPRFIGAWWLGFLVIGALLFLVNLPMFLFPKQLKGASVKESDRVEYANSHGFMDCTKRLLTNPLFMFNLIGNALRDTGYGGYGTTKPKYMESQYRVSGSKANLLTGVANLLPMAAGTLAGGIGIRYIKPRALYLIIYMFCLEWVSNLTMLASMFLGCPPLQLGPIGDTETTTFTMSAACNQGCDCTTSVFTPMCSADRVTTFFSPCYAGCTDFDKVTGIATNCTCISDHGGLATSGYCQSDADNCTNLVIDPKDKSFAMGFVNSFLALFAYIPYPLIFGAIADSVCLVWESTCGKTGNCWLYDQDRFRYVLHGVTLALIIVASLCDVAHE
ncbi:unnamed protein product [Medioppia subpectinata]|uniref:Kazal-like domain-containing protein n=1 Tax=Medioppia subpectinata TaxID=1979941 RepID=A0A7R9KFQ8_9ACAR|nr:unnamed protein product [Medioppia subpectinata]CAG2102525.1 unnamed protein product [Medioppia subpectinata]